MTYHPTSRVLAVLELLQARGRVSGPELARRLEVSERTVRHYITILQDLGIPVEAERGRYGAYRLRPGFKLPPLIFTEEESLALVVGLLAARRVGLAAAAPAVEGALAKVGRVMPRRLGDRLAAVERTLALDIGPAEVPPESAVVLALSEAVHLARRVRLRYGAAGGEETEREVDPYGLIWRRGR